MAGSMGSGAWRARPVGTLRLPVQRRHHQRKQDRRVPPGATGAAWTCHAPPFPARPSRWSGGTRREWVPLGTARMNWKQPISPMHMFGIWKKRKQTPVQRAKAASERPPWRMEHRKMPRNRTSSVNPMTAPDAMMARRSAVGAELHVRPTNRKAIIATHTGIAILMMPVVFCLMGSLQIRSHRRRRSAAETQERAMNAVSADFYGGGSEADGSRQRRPRLRPGAGDLEPRRDW